MKACIVCFSFQGAVACMHKKRVKDIKRMMQEKQIHPSGKYGNCVPSDSEGGAGTDKTNPKIGLWRSYSLYLYSKEGGLF